jgi:hypothetical protein
MRSRFFLWKRALDKLDELKPLVYILKVRKSASIKAVTFMNVLKVKSKWVCKYLT